MNNKINIPEYEVSQFNKLFKDIVESNFNYVRIKGEISEIKTASKGQIYLTLKDQDSILSGVIWDQKKKYLDIVPELGLEIIATGKITTWSRFKTTYQIDIDKIEIAGEGALLKLIEERKNKLFKKGYFDQDKKKAIPFLPSRVGIITSPTGSVIYDIINRVNDRFPLPLDIWPVAVQGVDAVSSISNAIMGFNNMIIEKPDVIIIARGGGSTEDLMAFNDESLAKKVFESKIPIVSAIGHETDTTIIDLVSDLRASTPTAAAEKTVPLKYDIEIHIKNLQFKLNNKVLSKYENIKDNFEYMNKLLKAPSFVIEFYNDKLNDSLKKLNLLILNKINFFRLNFKNISNLIHSPESSIKIKKIFIKDLFKNLDKNINKNYQNKIINFNSCSRLLKSNSISKNLNKGYSILMHKKKIIKSVKSLTVNTNVNLKLADGNVQANIKKIN